MLHRFLTSLVLFLPFGLLAQDDDERAVLTAVDRFFTALNQSDTSALAQLMVPGS